MAGTVTTEAPRGRGRPRSEKAHRAILEAAGTLMMEGGMAAATMEAIAARAGVSKATIYKWWPSRGAVALEGFLDQVKDSITIPDGLTARSALMYQLNNLCDLMRSETLAEMLRGVMSQAQSDSEIAKALIEQWVAPRQSVARAAIAQGIKSGELRADVEADFVIDQLFAPLYNRVTFGLTPYSPAETEILFEQLFKGIAAQ